MCLVLPVFEAYTAGITPCGFHESSVAARVPSSLDPSLLSHSQPTKLGIVLGFCHRISFAERSGLRAAQSHRPLLSGVRGAGKRPCVHTSSVCQPAPLQAPHGSLRKQIPRKRAAPCCIREGPESVPREKVGVWGPGPVCKEARSKRAPCSALTLGPSYRWAHPVGRHQPGGHRGTQLPRMAQRRQTHP